MIEWIKDKMRKRRITKALKIVAGRPFFKNSFINQTFFSDELTQANLERRPLPEYPVNIEIISGRRRKPYISRQQ